MQPETPLDLSNTEQAEKEAQKQRKRKFWLAAGVVYLVVIALVFYVLINRSAAMNKLDALDFQGAVRVFQRIPLGETLFPKDSAYLSAAQLVLEHKYDEAVAAFEQLPDDPQIENAVLEAKYQKAVYYFTCGEYEAASPAFLEVGDYRDAIQMEKESRCRYAGQLVDETEFDKALMILQKLQREQYEPAKDQMFHVYISKAELFTSKKAYAEAYQTLLDAQEYGDISALLPEYLDQAYQQAVSQYRNGEYDRAKRVFKKMGDYLQSKDYLLLIDVVYTAFYSYPTYDEMEKLKSLIGFEDTAKLLIDNNSFAYEFLMGSWKGQGCNFSINSHYDIDYDIPAFTYGDHYMFLDGCMLAYFQDNTAETKEIFRITILSEDRIQIYSLLNDTTYTLDRA